jgi:hypothetical protein
MFVYPTNAAVLSIRVTLEDIVIVHHRLNKVGRIGVVYFRAHNANLTSPPSAVTT